MKTQKIENELGKFQINQEKAILKLEGKFISLNPDKFWEWIIMSAKRTASNTDRIRIDLNIEYISTSNVKYLYMLMKTLINSKQTHTKMTVNWHYESFDENHLELGEMIKNSLPSNVKFQFVEELGKLAA